MRNQADRPGPTVTKLAELALVHRASVWRWLTGRAQPSRLALARLAQVGIVLQLPPPRRRRRR